MPYWLAYLLIHLGASFEADFDEAEPVNGFRVLRHTGRRYVRFGSVKFRLR